MILHCLLIHEPNGAYGLVPNYATVHAHRSNDSAALCVDRDLAD